ncbi:hypothetical protein MUP01_04040 [Candidatus Bathyarchaeota archaeon]|nr:hypothetical protein [Candidatus Bathyarchaeota archaeon]
MNDELQEVYLLAHYSEHHVNCASCVGAGDSLEFLENDLVEFRYPNSECSFCLWHSRLNKRFPMSQWKPLLDAKHFTLVSDPVRDHPERMRVVCTRKRRSRR